MEVGGVYERGRIGCRSLVVFPSAWRSIQVEGGAAAGSARGVAGSSGYVLCGWCSKQASSSIIADNCARVANNSRSPLSQWSN